MSRCTSVIHNSCYSVLYLFITTWQKTKKSHWWILQLRHIFGRTEKKWRRQVRNRTAWTALEMQIICIPVLQCEKMEPTYICEQSLLFLLIGRCFLSSEEKTVKKTPTNQAWRQLRKQLNELIVRCCDWMDRLLQYPAIGNTKFQAGIVRQYYIQWHWSTDRMVCLVLKCTTFKSCLITPQQYPKIFKIHSSHQR